MKQMSALELMQGFEAEDGLAKALERYKDATAVVRYENVYLSDRQNMGAVQMVMVGPSNTLKTLEDVVTHKTMPFQTLYGRSWQYYPQGWCPADEVRERIKAKV